MQPILVYTYRDVGQFQGQAGAMAAAGYYPVSQAWSPGSTQRNPILLVLGIIGLLFFILPGVVILIIWAAYAKTGPGLLTVTYQFTGVKATVPKPRPATFQDWVIETGVGNAREITRRQFRAGEIDQANYDQRMAIIDSMKLD